MPESTQLAHWLLQDVTETVTTYAHEQSAAMIAIIGPVAASMLAIYVMLWGAGIASGQISEPFTDGAKRIIRMCAIIAFALTAGIYQTSVADFFLKVPAAMATELSYEGASSDGTSDGIADVLDASLQKGLDVGTEVWEQADEMANEGIKSAIAAIPYYAMALVIDIASAVIVAIGAGILFVAFIALSILLAVGPLFVLLAIFPQTQRFFEAWTGQVVNYAILYLLVAVTIGLCFALFDKFVTDLPVTTLPELVISAIKLVGAVIAIVAVLLQTRSIASGLGGGVALSAQGLAGKLAGGATSLARAGMTGNSGRGVGSALSSKMGGERAVGWAANKAGSAIKSAAARVRARFNSNSVSEG